MDERLTAPNDLVKTLQTTMQGALDTTGVIVGRKRVFLFIETKFPVCDAIAIASDNGTKIRGVLDVFCQRFVTEHDVLTPTLAVRGLETENDRAIGHCAELDAIFVNEREDLDRRTIGCRAKRFRFGWLGGHRMGSHRDGENDGVLFHGWVIGVDLDDN